MLFNVALAGFLMVVTTGIHAGGMILALRIAQIAKKTKYDRLPCPQGQQHHSSDVWHFCPGGVGLGYCLSCIKCD